MGCLWYIVWKSNLLGFEILVTCGESKALSRVKNQGINYSSEVIRLTFILLDICELDGVFFVEASRRGLSWLLYKATMKLDFGILRANTASLYFGQVQCQS